MIHEYGDDIEYSDYDEVGDDEEEVEEEVEYEDEERQPTQEEIEYLELRQRLKESIRKKMKRKEVGGSHLNSQEKKTKLPFNDFGSFFGPSQPVISSRVIQESKSLLENQQLTSRLLNSRNNSKKPVSSSSSRLKDEPSDRRKDGPSDRRPNVVNELKRKVEKLKDTRDYSFLFSDDVDVPVPRKEPSSQTIRTSSPAKHKQPLGGDGRSGSGGFDDKKLGPTNSHLNSKPGSSGNQLHTRPVSLGRQLPTKPGPSGRQLPPKQGSSSTQLHSRASSLGGQLSSRPGSSGSQLPARHGSSGSQMQARQGSSNSQLHQRQGSSGTQMHSRPVSSGSQMNARQGISGSQINPRSSFSGSQAHSRTVSSANGQLHSKQVPLTNGQMHSKSTIHKSASIRRPESMPTVKKTPLSGSKSIPNGAQRSISSRPQQSIMRQNGEQRKVSHEPSRSQMVPKQSAALSRHQINRPLKQQSQSRDAVDHRRPKKKPVNMSEDDLALSMIRKMFKTDRYAGREVDDDDSDMEANFDDIMREESRSARIAKKEDEEQLRLIEEEERRERMRKLAKKRKLNH